MYKTDDKNQLEIAGFSLPFDGKLRKRNRWVVLAGKINWDEMESEYAAHFSAKGKRAIKCRVALGALIIKEQLGLSDRETVEQICENPYMQYFLGYKSFSSRRPFSPATMISFRKRFASEHYKKKNIKVK